MPRERGSGLYCGSGSAPSYTRSRPSQTWRKIVSTPGGRRNAAPILAPEIGTLSPSVITSSSRAREVGVKKRRLTTLSSASSRVAVDANVPCGGGRSIPIERSQRRDEDVLVDAREEVRQHAVGERGEPDRHVLERAAEPQRRAAWRARTGSASRVPSGQASSETCRCTTKTSASDRTLRADVHSSRGCAAASPSSAAATSQRGQRQAAGRAPPAPAARSPGAPGHRGGARARARRAARRRRARAARRAGSAA